MDPKINDFQPPCPLMPTWINKPLGCWFSINLGGSLGLYYYFWGFTWVTTVPCPVVDLKICIYTVYKLFNYISHLKFHDHEWHIRFFLNKKNMINWYHLTWSTLCVFPISFVSLIFSTSASPHRCHPGESRGWLRGLTVTGCPWLGHWGWERYHQVTTTHN